ncbi:hypothetical protein [Candidatus Vondammii sp. HM_W22]|uniref:hypothetical protein n=1 Tax=Candidatus Vondammii sp. HM_W22 TaxID=2687299 RepID=UPI002E7B7A8B|nr:hypothetical protein [Candidatus Vondammii sp. HM_W22]
MQVSNWFAATFVGVAVMVVVFVRWVNKRSVLNKHELISLVKMYQQEASHIDVSYEIFEQVLNLIGQALRYRPQKT